jgi:hypothetical protein
MLGVTFHWKVEGRQRAQECEHRKPSGEEAAAEHQILSLPSCALGSICTYPLCFVGQPSYVMHLGF